MADPDWHLWRAFASVLRTGSLSGASRELRVPQPTIGRQIACLETALGMKLFTRSRDGLAPTAQAQRLGPRAIAMEAAAAALLRAVSRDVDDPSLNGTVRLTASEMVAATLLPPLLAEITAPHPALTLELAASDRIEDLLRRDADIAIRHVRPSQGALRAKRLGAAPLGLFAHRDYVERRGLPDTAAALAGHSLIGWDRRLDPERGPWALAAGVSTAFTIRCSSDPLQWAMLRAGAGIGICQVGIASQAPELVAVLPTLALPTLPFWLAMHEDLAQDPSVRLVFDALAAGLGRYLGAST